MNKIINGVWFAPKLTAIQKLSIKSYMDCGHEFHLYSFNPIEGVPEGAVVKDASEIISRSMVSKFPHNSQAADYFRILLILKKGGWYVDLDTVCLKHFDFIEPYVFASEDHRPGHFEGQKDPRSGPPTPCLEEVTGYISNSTFKAPIGSPYLASLADKIEKSDTLHPESWISFGPALFSDALPKFSLQQYVKSPVVFDAVNPNELFYLVDGDITWNFSEKSYAMHFRTSWWQGRLSEAHSSGSLFERLKRKHGIN